MTSSRSVRKPQKKGFMTPSFEHDACGIGFVASVKGEANHEIVSQALQILKNMDHRGAVGADPLCGDGSGILIQMPDQFFRAEMSKQGITLPSRGDYGVGMVFLPREQASKRACEQELERTIKAEGQVVLGWRDVPVNNNIPISQTVMDTAPIIRQVFIGRGPDVMVPAALERKLYVIRKYAGHKIQALKLKHGKDFYVPSMSTKTIVYKGLLLADQLGAYFPDLNDPESGFRIGLGASALFNKYFPKLAVGSPIPYGRS